MKKSRSILLLSVLLLTACNKPVTYPDEPVISFLDYYLYYAENELGTMTLTADLVFSFTDGDGNVGMAEPDTSEVKNEPDTVLYNLFLREYAFINDVFDTIPEDEGGLLKYRIPLMDQSPLNGTITIKLEYPILVYDTVFYTFYIYDEDYNRSNTDSTYIIVFTGIPTDGDSVRFTGSR